MYIFGGQRNVGHNTNNTYVYSFGSGEWRIIAAGNEVPALDSHSAVIHRKSMLVLGGYVA